MADGVDKEMRDVIKSCLFQILTLASFYRGYRLNELKGMTFIRIIRGIPSRERGRRNLTLDVVSDTELWRLLFSNAKLN